MSKIFTLLFVIVALAYVFLLRSFRLADPSNSVNQQYRPLFLQSSVARSLFFLNRPGDGRFEYFSPEKDTVLVEIDYQVGRNPDERIEKWIANLVLETLRKDVEVVVTEQGEILDIEGLPDKALRSLARSTRNRVSGESRSYLHIVYISSSLDASSNTGLSLTANEIFIFKDRIYELSQKANVRSLIEQSTLKHEFGHLLGLEHVDSEDCVMSERVEVYEKRKYQFDAIPLDFCEESLEGLRRIEEDAL